MTSLIQKVQVRHNTLLLVSVRDTHGWGSFERAADLLAPRQCLLESRGWCTVMACSWDISFHPARYFEVQIFKFTDDNLVLVSNLEEKMGAAAGCHPII